MKNSILKLGFKVRQALPHIWREVRFCAGGWACWWYLFNEGMWRGECEILLTSELGERTRVTATIPKGGMLQEEDGKLTISYTIVRVFTVEKTCVPCPSVEISWRGFVVTPPFLVKYETA